MFCTSKRHSYEDILTYFNIRNKEIFKKKHAFTAHEYFSSRHEIVLVKKFQRLKIQGTREDLLCKTLICFHPLTYNYSFFYCKTPILDNSFVCFDCMTLPKTLYFLKLSNTIWLVKRQWRKYLGNIFPSYHLLQVCMFQKMTSF